MNTAWAFAKLAVKESVVLMKHARVTITNRAEDNTLTLPNICTLVWAINSCTGGGGGDSADTSTANDFASVSESLASAAERLAYESSPNELAATAWTFADAGEFNTEAHRSLFKTLSKRVSLILLNGAGGDINTSSANSSETSFGDEELDNLEWAFSKAGNPGSVLRVIKKKKKDSTGVLGMAGGKVNSRFDPSSDPSQLKSSSVPGTAKDGKSSLNGDTHGRSSPQNCGTIVVAGGGVGGAEGSVMNLSPPAGPAAHGGGGGREDGAGGGKRWATEGGGGGGRWGREAGGRTRDAHRHGTRRTWRRHRGIEAEACQHSRYANRRSGSV